MKYIVSFENQFCLLGKEFISVKDGQIRGHHNPECANFFQTKKECKDFIKENENTFYNFSEASIVLLLDACKEYNEYLKGEMIYRSSSVVDKSLNFEYDKDKHDADDILNWHIKYRSHKNPDSACSSKSYRSWPSPFEVFKYLFEVQAYYQDNDYSQKYLTFKFGIKKDGDYSGFKEEFDKVVEHVTYLDDDEYKIFSIIDENLGEGGDFVYLKYKNDSDAKISSTYSNYISGSLEKCFGYLKRNRFYN
jgi:hypothetical protein